MDNGGFQALKIVQNQIFRCESSDLFIYFFLVFLNLKSHDTELYIIIAPS